MKLITIYNQMRLEALKPSEFKRLYKLDRSLALKRIDSIWSKLKSQSFQHNRNGERLYFQLEGGSEIQGNPIEQEVSNYLNNNGFEVVDFKNNLGKKKGDKNQMKIGKILTMLGKKDNNAIDILNKMNTSTTRSGVKSSQVIVISKAPYDIGGSSTDRGWNSRMITV